MLTGKYVSVNDKLQFLWMLCLIAHYNEIGKKVTWHNIEEEFGLEIVKRFHFYREIAMSMKLVKYNSHQLTPKGQAIVDRWQSIRNRIINNT